MTPARSRQAQAVAFGGTFGLFVLLAADLILHGPVTAADPSISNWFHAHPSPAATLLFMALTQMHSTIGLSVMSGGIAAVLLWTHRARWIIHLLAIVQGGQILNAGVKHLFERARPAWDHPLVHLTTYSFPSGHAAGATVFWGFALILWCAGQPQRTGRLAFVVLAVVMVSLTAVSRVYLGAHYTSDVLAGIAEGASWVLLCRMVLPTRASMMA